jgi:hypothetical protein
MSLDPHEVSVVVQGPAGPHLQDVLGSVRRFLPAAELVLSTWRGTGGEAADVDVLVESDDPGSVPYWPGNPRPVNTNRLLRSTREGVRAAQRPHVLKLRSDTPLTGSGFLDWWGAHPRRSADLVVFRRRVLTISVATRPASMDNHLFHPSDCVQFGLREDLLHLWSTPEVDEVANTGHWLPGGAGAGAPPVGPPLAHWNEQVVWLSALRRAGHEVDYPFYRYLRPGLAALSERALVNNFLVLDEWQFGVALAKLQAEVRVCRLSEYLSYEDWLRVYTQQARPLAA